MLNANIKKMDTLIHYISIKNQ